MECLTKKLFLKANEKPHSHPIKINLIFHYINQQLCRQIKKIEICQQFNIISSNCSTKTNKKIKYGSSEKESQLIKN